jgi:hypothetical protein
MTRSSAVFFPATLPQRVDVRFRAYAETVTRRDPRVVVEGRETVIYERGVDWPFTLPEGHVIEVFGGYVGLSVGGKSSVFALEDLDLSSDPEEARVRLGALVGANGPLAPEGTPREAPGYPLPELHHEIEHLRERWRSAGGDPKALEGWAPEDLDDRNLEPVRAALRRLEAWRAAA